MIKLDDYGIQKLLTVIEEVHSQHADDLCWLDIDKIFIAAGLPVPDRKVGDQFAMWMNCKRFIKTMCSEGGPWQSYANLEEELAAYKEGLERLGLSDQDAVNDHVTERLKR